MRAVSRFFDFCSMSREEKSKLSLPSSQQERLKVTEPLDSISKHRVLKVAPMSFLEEATCVIFLAFAVPNGIFTVPVVTGMLGYAWGNILGAYKVLLVCLVPLALFPQPFVPSTLNSWLSGLVVRYFSFRFAYDECPPTQSETNKKQRPQILVAPPHGVFPYGNILAMLVWPSLCGHHFRGLAANSALRVPIFKQILRSIGVIDASRETARMALESYPYTIGISTGGVAEVFETNSQDECVLLKERIGLIKLAIRTGSDLVPCYLFGNTKLLSCWMPGGRLLERISRKLGFATLVIWGRFGLPIPYRISVFGVTGTPIPTSHLQCEDPAMEMILEVQNELINGMTNLFDKYKGYYGWDHKSLIIK